jgi:hypothetical protein
MIFRLFRRSIVLISSALIILAVACGGGDDDPTAVPTQPSTSAPATATAIPIQPTETFVPPPTAAPTPVPTLAPTATTAPQPTATATPRPPTPTPTPSAPSLARAKAISLASTELGVPASDITVLSQDLETWPTTGLGCEVPGRVYAQIQVSGWKVVVNGGGVTLEIHADGLGENIISCAAAVSLSSTPSLNLVEVAKLTGITSIVVLALPPGSDPVEFVRVDDASRIAIALDALSSDTHLADKSDCTALFQLDFVSDAGTVSFLYACSGAGETIRGEQAFWNGQDGIAPGPFQKLINEALAAREFPAFPPQN